MYLLIFWTAANSEEAKKIARELVAKKWVACASIIPEVISLFSWKGKGEEAIEAKVMFKTKKNYFPQILEYIQKHCSYEVPEVLQIAIRDGNPSYLKWMDELLK